MPRESKADRKKRAAKITAILKKRYPDARTALNHGDALELLVATILSAQCTDDRVNIVTKDLFQKYKTPKDYADAPQQMLQEEIRTTGFYRNKAKSIRASAKKIIEDFGGRVPDTMDELLSLPGVARKTANVVLGGIFGKNEGIAVDTHVMRISQRLKLTSHKNNQGDRIEKDLMELVPRRDWTLFGNVVIFHGRQICSARKPNCPQCPINNLCPSAFSFGNQ
jgi:endonuclease-3